jgi:hypothetical protein
LACAGRAIWAGDTLSAFVFLLTRSTTAVGALTGVRGLAQIFLAPFCGTAADRLARHTLVRLGSVIGVCAAAIGVVGVLTSSYAGLCAALLLWGTYWATTSPAIDALFADSVDAGGRSAAFTRKSQLNQLGSAMGPLVSLICFRPLATSGPVRASERARRGVRVCARGLPAPARMPRVPRVRHVVSRAAALLAARGCARVWCAFCLPAER